MKTTLEKSKSKPFPRITKKTLPSGSVEEITDTGIYQHKLRKAPLAPGQHWNVGFLGQNRKSIYRILDKIKVAVEADLEKVSLPHKRRFYENVLEEVSLAEDSLSANQIEQAMVACLQLGKWLEMLRVGEVEPYFARKRKSDEGTRQPRRVQSDWNELGHYWIKMAQAGAELTHDQLRGRYVRGEIHGLPGGKRVNRQSFRTEFYRKRPGWLETVNRKP